MVSVPFVHENSGAASSRVAGDLRAICGVCEEVWNVDRALTSEVGLVEKQDVDFLLLNEVYEFKAPPSDALAVPE